MGLNSENVFGEQVGRYTLLEKLGEGGMASVYNAYDAHRGNNVAIKIILPSRRDSQVFLERFAIESKSLAQLSHTNIVKVLDYGEVNGNPYLVMEYVPGGTLKDFMNGPVPYALAAKILLPVARALEYVHSLGIIHRDVKPANILIDEDDQPKLSDFGVIQLLASKEKEEEQSVTGVGIGTPDYMSPEQGLGKTVDSRADTYALGVIFYELITGQKPFMAETPMAIAIKHATEPFPKPSKLVKSLPGIVEDVLMKAVAKDPENRYANIGEFADALEILAKNQPLKDARLRKLAVVRGGRQVRRRLVTWAAVGAVLAAGLIGGWLTKDGWLPMIRGAATEAIAETTSLPVDVEEPTQAPTLAWTSTPALAAVAEVTPSITTVLPTSAPTALNMMPYSSIVRSLQNGVPDKIDLWGLGGVTGADWAPDRSQFAIGTTEGVAVYDGESYEMVQFIDLDTWVDLVTYSADGKHLYAGLRNGRVMAWSVDNNFVKDHEYSSAGSMTGESRAGVSAPVEAIAFHDSLGLMAIGYQNGTIKIIQLSKGTVVGSFEQYPSVRRVLFSQDGRWLYTTRDESKLLGIFDLNSKQYREVELPGSVSEMVMFNDGSKLVLGGLGEAIYLWDLNEEKLLYSFVGLGDQVTGLSIDPQGQWITVGLANGTVGVYPVPDPSQYYSTLTAAMTAQNHASAITGIAYAQDGGRVVSTSIQEGFKVWNSESGEILFSMERRYPAVKRMAFSPDDRWLAVDYADGVVRVFNTTDGELLFEYTGQMANGDPFSHDGKYFTVMYYDRKYMLSVIAYPSGEIVQTLQGIGGDWLTGFSPDDTIFVAGNTYQAMVWDVTTWTQVSIHGGPNSGCGMFFTPDNRMVATFWEAAVIFEQNSNMEILCSTKPTFAKGVHLARDYSYAIFQNNDGGLWKFRYDPNQANLQRTNQRSTNVFLFSGSSVNDHYYLEEDNSRFLLTDGNFRILHEFAGHELYDYVGAISSDDRLLAVATKYGNIAIWGVK